MGSRERFRFAHDGTTFTIFAQLRSLGFTPEHIRVDASRGPIKPGPADDTIEVIDALDKPSYFSDTTGKLGRRRPPYPKDGPRSSRVATPRHGDFTHIKPRDRAVAAALV